ncbi:GT4 family glycosyltransferase PelF [Streptococcus sp. 10F2]
MGSVSKNTKPVIALVVEGAYPYRRGGLSNWIQDFIKGMEAYSFYLITIVDRRETCGSWVYELPQNIIGSQELVLEGMFLEEEEVGWGLSSNPEQWLVELMDLETSSLTSTRKALQSPRVFSDLFQWIKYTYPNAAFIPLYRQLQALFGNLLDLLAQIILPEHLHCIHALSTGYAGYLAAYLSRKLRCPFILSEHGLYLLEKEEVLSRSSQLSLAQKDSIRWFFGEMSRISYGQARTVTTLFKEAQKHQVQLGCPASKCQVVPNGLIWKDWREVQRQTDNQKLQIGAILRWTPLKNVLELLFIHANLCHKGYPVTLVILGAPDDITYWEVCQAAILRWRIPRVEIQGHCCVQDYLVHWTCLVLPSLSEGQPLALLEAMAAGIPCVASDVGSCHQLLCQDLEGRVPAGICVRPGDREGFVQALMQILDNPELGVQMGQAGRRRVQDFYQQEQVLAAYQRIYEVD